MTKLPPDVERLRDEMLEASGFRDIESRDGIITRRPMVKETLPVDAEARLWDYRCDERERAILELFVGGYKRRAIARKLKRKRDTVNAVCKRFVAWLDGAEREKRGRPAEHGRTDGCLLAGARFADGPEAEAFWFLWDHIRKEQPGATKGDVLRAATILAASVISVNGKKGAK